MESQPLKVGDTVYIFDQNHRVYKDRRSGPIYRGHFIPVEITGETTRSFVFHRGCVDYKIAKSEIAGKNRVHASGGRYGGYSVFLSKSAMDDDIWIHENRHKITESVGRITDVETLRSVASIIGYSEGDSADI